MNHINAAPLCLMPFFCMERKCGLDLLCRDGDDVAKEGQLNPSVQEPMYQVYLSWSSLGVPAHSETPVLFLMQTAGRNMWSLPPLARHGEAPADS